MAVFDVRIRGLGIEGAQRGLAGTESVIRLIGRSNDPESEVIALVEAEDVFTVENVMATLLPLYCSFSVRTQTQSA